jgi:hypothetical protein
MEGKDVTFLLQTPSSLLTFVFFFLHAAYRRIFTAIDWSRGSGRMASLLKLLVCFLRLAPTGAGGPAVGWTRLFLV